MKTKGTTMNDLPALYPTRPFTNEVVVIGDARIPYNLTHDDFHGSDVPVLQALRRGKIYELQALVHTHGEDELVLGACQLIHHLSPGIYVREFRMMAGSIIVSHRHSREHIVQVLAGRATVVTEYGTEEIEAPATFISPAGSKRILFNHTDTIWTTTHRTDATTIEEAEAELIIQEPNEIKEAAKRVSGVTLAEFLANTNIHLLGNKG